MGTRTESRQKRLAGEQLRRLRPGHSEVHEIIIGVEPHVAIHLKRGWDRSAYACVVRRGFHCAGCDVGEEFSEVDLQDLP
jgi:hypothetical protein